MNWEFVLLCAAKDEEVNGLEAHDNLLGICPQESPGDKECWPPSQLELGYCVGPQQNFSTHSCLYQTRKL